MKTRALVRRPRVRRADQDDRVGRMRPTPGNQQPTEIRREPPLLPGSAQRSSGDPEGGRRPAKTLPEAVARCSRMARRDRRPLGACRVIFWCRSSGWPPPTSLRHPHRYRRSCRGQHHRRCHGDGNRSEAQRVVEQQPQSEQQEQQASQDLQQPLRKAPVQQQPCADRQAVGQIMPRVVPIHTPAQW